MYFTGKEKRDPGKWWKPYGMRDSRENEAGMRDQDPPFQTLVAKFCAKFLTEAKISVIVVERRLYNYNIDCLCLQRIELRWNELFPKFWRRFCENQGRENFVLFRCGSVSPIFCWSSKFAFLSPSKLSSAREAGSCVTSGHHLRLVSIRSQTIADDRGSQTIAKRAVSI